MNMGKAINSPKDRILITPNEATAIGEKIAGGRLDDV